MKFSYGFFVLCILFRFNAKAQNIYQQSTLLGYAEDSNCQLYMDDEGNAYAIINSRYDINFHGQLFSRHGASDYSVIGKFDSSGKMLWARTISTDANPANNPTDIIYDLQVDADKNIYISGAGGGITLDDGTVLPGGTFLIKFNGKGNTLWGIISENTQSSSMIGGPIALAKDGVYWSSIFYGKLQLQNYVLNTTNPYNGTPNAFVAKVNSGGQITSIYHDPALASIPQIMVTADNGNASVVVSRGGLSKHRVILDANCNSLSDLPFLNYGDFPTKVRSYNNNGYEMLTNVYGQDKNGVYPLGFYYVKFDRNLSVTDSIKLFPNPFNNRIIYDAINNNSNGYYLNSPIQTLSNTFDWILMDGSFNQTILKPEIRNVFGEDAFTRNFVKMSGDTLNMQMRHSNDYTTSFVLNQQQYTVPYNLDETYFWTK